MFDLTAHKGFSLLEVLIAAVIFSIGLLGLASLQVTGLKMSHDSLLRSTASIYANDMADRMRANYPAFLEGQGGPYDNPTGANAGLAGCLGKTGAGANADQSCTSSQIAQEDFYEWLASIKGHAATAWHSEYPVGLPSGDGIVCVDSTPEDGTPSAPACDGVVAVPNKPVFAIKIWWRERKDDAADNTLHRFVTSISL